MPHQPLDYQQLSDRLCVTALEAGRKIMDIFACDFSVAYKDDRSPVTDADEAAEKIILQDLRALTPDIPVIAEEEASAGISPEVGDRFWLVDPLDGTKEFVKKGTDFTVNIALIEKGDPTFGIVFAPALNRMFVARGPGFAVQMDVMAGRDLGPEQPLAVRDIPPSGPVAVASKSHRDAQTNAFLDQLKITDIVSTGSSLKFCLLAAGEADIYPRFGPTMEWDTAAGHAILRAAGGAVVNPDGTPFRYRKPDFRNGHFIASGRADHLLKDILAQRPDPA